jgi:integrase
VDKETSKMANERFTNRKVDELKGKQIYAIGNNLYVREKSGGRKYYVHRYRERIGLNNADREPAAAHNGEQGGKKKAAGKKIEMTFGRTTKFDIQQAQAWAQELNLLLAKGTDPRTHKAQKQQAADKAALTRKTFGEVAQLYVEERTDPKDPTRWVPHTANQMRSIMGDILPSLGDVFVNDPELVQLKGVMLIKSRAETAPTMALRIRDFLKGAMGFARDLKCYSGENPFSTEAGINRLAPIRHTSKRHQGWHHKELPRLMKLLLTALTDCGYDDWWTTAQAAKAMGRDRVFILTAIRKGLLSTRQTSVGYLVNPAEVRKLGPIINPEPEPSSGEKRLAVTVARFLVLTGVRFSEANEMIWEEVDWTTRTCLIGRDRTKKLIEHILPLSPPAYDILRQQQARGIDSPYVFGRGPTLTGTDFLGKPLSDTCVRNHVRKAVGDPFITLHAFRRNVSSWAKEKGYSLEVRRMLRGHATGKVVDGFYECDAGEVANLRDLLESWANYLNGPPSSANVVSLTERRTSNA